MEFQRAVRKRRMVRHFTNEPVSMQTISGILELAQHAPSAGFSQGSAYVVVTDPEVKKKVARVQGEEDYSASGFHRWISGAPVAIVACVSEKLYHDRYNEPDKLNDEGKEIEWPTPYWFFDIGAGCLIILLGAVDVGLAAAFSGVFDVKAMKALLGIPPHFHPVGVISIGHGAKDVKSPSLKRGRRQLADVVHYEKW
ncbi:MAG TPA: nitroreductase family protein [Nitrososphaerales archaeon]|nr:nitroreductase family protein [Nitrososphaerales archaeon]